MAANGRTPEPRTPGPDSPLIPERPRWSTHQLLSMAARSVERRWDNSLARVGLNHAGVLALQGLAQAGPVTQEALAALIRVQSQTLGRVLARMEAAGYVSRCRSATDRRSNQVRITEPGRDVLRAAQEVEHSLLPARFRSGSLHRELTALIREGDPA
ncbi:MarR family transcriptional regulator [Arthrobacter sp. AL08]|uniref:MarR family winged helix-turn-helix transcriptional regulator n=1 Tax=unclassified Arthrobacter TaxID=235627 RepID=UPI00249CA2BE|nr:MULTISPECIES: MarR family transcriptional regulator [unclassified Arthrobacter]MDI3243335.1 MarR family transcriptional regulator [Arthrobacter sp. AL05]MDI3279359.1 MarR family transcriptional regulator [Arthrobacter sp. AL08]